MTASNQQAQTEEALRDKTSAWQSLAEMGREIMAAPDPWEILDMFCLWAAELVRAPKSALFVERSPGEVILAASYGLYDPAGMAEEFKSLRRTGVFQSIHAEARDVVEVAEVSHDDPNMPQTRAREGIRAYVYVLLVASGQVMGVLIAGDVVPRAWPADELQLLSWLVSQLAVAFDKAFLHQETLDRAEQLALLYEAGLTLNRELDPSQQLSVVFEIAMKALRAERAEFYRYDALNDMLSFEVGVGYGREVYDTRRRMSVHLRDEKSIVSWVGRSQASLYVADVPIHSGREGVDSLIRSGLWVPIHYERRLRGVLGILSTHYDAFTPQDEQMLNLFANQAAIAMENARLFEETRRRLDELEIVSEVALGGATGETFDETVSHATLILGGLWPDGQVNFLFMDETGQALRPPEPGQGMHIGDPTRAQLALEHGAIGWLVRERRPIRLGDLSLGNGAPLRNSTASDSRWISLVAGSRSEMAAPLIMARRLIGVVNVESPRPNAFSEDDLRLLTTVAGQLATIFEKARLDTALSRYADFLELRVDERTAELSAANVELARAARLKDEFLASMSHELRTPLTSILGLSEALLEGTFGLLGEQQLRPVRTIEESGRHLLALINDILDLSKIEAGKFDLLLGQVVVSSVCKASLQLVRQAASAKQIEVSSSLDERVEAIWADERRLKQILVNLLSNAVKFTPPAGEIGLTVSGDAEQQVAHFSVWDTGIGIAREDMQRLFKPFVQLDSSLSRQYPGTGLGLSLVYRMTEMHGGSVSVESETGRGSRFTVSLPWGDAPTERKAGSPTKEVARPAFPSPARLLTILLAEDNQFTIDGLSDCLSTKGYRLVVTHDGFETLNLVGEVKPDLMLVDLQLPGLDGLGVIRLVRTMANLRTVPIVALTALALPGDREQCLAGGADEYLVKPLGSQQLVGMIEAQIANRKP
ncbi:MAG: GAF domain-containing protein [Thermoflexales bacterium]|nr:GAF domain-containing protein [Thermoflexales bacterium]